MAQSAVDVRVSPSAAEVVASETVDVAVEVVDVQEIYGFDVSLTFDPTVVEVVDADPDLQGVQVALGLFLDPGFVLVNEADNEAGTVRLAMTQLNPSQPKSGTGNLVVLTLRGKEADRSTPLALVEARLVQSDGTKLPVELLSAQVDVVASKGEEPTNTPIPTQGPGTPMPTLTPTSPGPGTEVPQPTATASPTHTVGPDTPTAATPTPTPTSTSTPSRAAVEGTEVPSAPTQSPSESPLVPPPASATPQPSSTPPSVVTEDSTGAVGATAGPTRVAVQVPAGSGSVHSGPGGEARSDGGRAFLWVSLGAAGLALLLGGTAAVLVLTRRRRSGGEEDAGP